MKKQGELTTQQLVTLIILIASFSILLYFYFTLDFGQTSNKEICHDSVIKQSNFVSNKLPGANLQCSTEYLCISGGEDCEGFVYDRKIDLDLGSNYNENEKKIFKAISEEMADCWWMFGEGKIDFSNSFSDNVYCGICSIVKFDSEVMSVVGDTIPYSSFLDYIKNTKMDNSKTYFQYFSFNEVYDTSFYVEDKDIYLNREYAIFMGIDNDEKWSISARQPEEKGFSIPPLFLEKTKESYNKVGCKVFVTNA